MRTFTLICQDAAHALRIERAVSFVGEDPSGSFGILAGHTRMMTVLVMGLARYRETDGPWQYLAMPGAVLYFCNNVLTLSTRRFLKDSDYNRISQALRDQLAAEEARLRDTKASLRRMEEEILRRMWEMGRKEA